MKKVPCSHKDLITAFRTGLEKENQGVILILFTYYAQNEHSACFKLLFWGLASKGISWEKGNDWSMTPEERWCVITSQTHG